ncbi:MAG: GIY-YIG nuclease family protein [Chloroflexi bacterium]|nr:GIY-YIG nuclease family protein [Chloroflexota bacterium]
MTRQYYVYVMTNRSRTLYVWITNDLERRVHKHKSESIEGSTKRYKLNRLVYLDATSSIEGAVNREKELKKWRRSKKIDLIEAANPRWKDLSEDWYEVGRQQ